MYPHKCPVCEGRGNVPNGFYDPHEYSPTSTVLMTEICKSCNGQGILWGWDSSPIPDHPPWVSPGDGNTTSPPFTITWENPMNLDNLPPNDQHGNTINSPCKITLIPADMLSNKNDETIVCNPRREV